MTSAIAIESEIRQLKQKLESDVGSGQYEILTADVAIVQIKFKISSYRILTCVAQITDKYPNEDLLIELKSKYFSPVLVKRLTSLPRVKKYFTYKPIEKISKKLPPISYR